MELLVLYVSARTWRNEKTQTKAGSYFAANLVRCGEQSQRAYAHDAAPAQLCADLANLSSCVLRAVWW